MSDINKDERCPICGFFMRSFRTHYWRDKTLTFPYNIYRCGKHGIYVKRQDRFELINFPQILDEAKKIEVIKEANVQWFDPSIVNMKCPICGEKWIQYQEFPSPNYGGVVFCPNNHSIKKEKALQK